MNSSHSSSTSLKSRVWFAAFALAIINCVIGVAGYLTLSFLALDPILTFGATFIVLSAVTLGFGWWLSRDLLRPIEEVALLARSIERSPSSTLPRTTGAIETDQLLQTLHRSGQQIRNLISVMDEVAAGRTEAATVPLESSDRLSASFQKLVSKVTDSINAKQELDDLQKAVSKLSSDISRVRGGQLDLNLRTDQSQTKEIAEAVRFLTSRLAGVTQQIFATTLEGERAVTAVRTSLQAGLESIDQRAGLGNPENPKHGTQLEGLLDQLAAECKNSSDLYDRYITENAASSKVSAASEQFRNGVTETNRLVHKLRNRTSEITNVARQAQDIAKRSKLITVNAAIASESSASPGVLANEIKDLTDRSEDLHKQIIMAGESLNSEIAGIEKEIASLVDVAPDLSRSLTGGANLSHSLCESVVQIVEIETKIRGEVKDLRAETERLKAMVQKLSDMSSTTAIVRESELNVGRLSSLLSGLRESVSDLKISAATAPRSIATEQTTAPLPDAPKVAEPLELPVNNGSFEKFVQASPTLLHAETPAAIAGIESLAPSFGEN